MLPLLFWQIFWVVLLLAILWLGAEVLRRQEIAPETVRKVVHIGTGHVILLAWGLKIPLVFCLIASVVASILTLVSYRIPILESINGVGRKSLGTFYYAVSIGIVTALFWPSEQYHFGALGILVMAYGDGLAALVGQRYGKRIYTVLGMAKTVEGSLTMALVSTLVSGLVLSVGIGWSFGIWGIALLIGIGAMFLEMFSRGGIDNLTVPVGSAILAWVLCTIIPKSLIGF
jgi:phytol kinase